MSAASPQYDVVIVGAGVAGNTIAKQLGLAGKKVLILEAGPAVPDSREQYMENFYLAIAKTPESPYPALAGRTGSKEHPTGVLPDPAVLPTPRATVLAIGGPPEVSYLVQAEPNATHADPPQNPPTRPDGNVRGLQFSSSYERIGGGTSWHWLGTSLRELENDIRLKTKYGHGYDWPLTYSELQELWAMAEKEIGVAASTAQQEPLEVVGLEFPPGYQYPMGPIPMSIVDQTIGTAVAGMQVPGMLDDSDSHLYDVFVTPTPAGRNSEPYDERRVCAGNTNCIPICPIQAKYDPSVTLEQALNTGNVTIWPQTVATEVIVDMNGRVTQIKYVQYQQPGGPQTGSGSVTAKIFVLAAHAIETPKLLLMSTNQGRTKNGVANSSLQVGKNLMDHPLYLAWALAPQPIFGYRGPLATSGIESTRDGSFRNQRAAFRIEIGNEGWNFPINDPYTTTTDFINGLNQSGLNPIGGGTPQALFGPALTQALNNALSRQFRFGFLVEQSPDQTNTVTLASQKDNLGLPRPKITYGFSQYTLAGLGAAVEAADQIFGQMKAQQFTVPPEDNDPSKIEVPVNGKTKTIKFFGSGHIVGTYRMGPTKGDSVVNSEQRSWDHPNLFLVGSGVFPTVATGNPTLTIAALALWAAQTIKKDLG